MTDKNDNTSRAFSAKVVSYLRKTRSLKEIGELTGCTESFISLVGSGKRSFTIDHLLAIETSLAKPLPLLILESLEGSVSKKIKSQYDKLRSIYEKSYKLRSSLNNK